MIALIDMDIVSFRCAASCQAVGVSEKTGEKEIVVEPVEIGYARVNGMMESILLETKATSYKGFLTDSDGNFRKSVCEEYKANRKDTVRPVLLPALNDFLIQSWGAIRAVGEEADDLLGIAQVEAAAWGKNDWHSTIICSIDKDLHQIAGKHYDIVKKEFIEVTEEEGLYFFYKQLLMGDSVDNIKGCPGIGPKKAEKLLAHVTGDEERMMEVVWNTYAQCFPRLDASEREELITITGRLVWIRKHVGEMWSIPTFM